jgi:D-sedoheptulose 7-phosphate isomerase
MHANYIAHAFEQNRILLSETLKLCKDPLETAVLTCCESIKNGGKLFFMGNGGSAAQAAHFTAELTGRFLLHRPGLPAICLNNAQADMTSIANDFGFEYIFERQIEALAQALDVCIVLSTSGNSPNVLTALKKSREIGMKTIGFAGNNGGAMITLLDCILCVPSNSTPRIQEMHTLLGHLLCEGIEQNLFANR